jgi:hypothetical protein
MAAVGLMPSLRQSASASATSRLSIRHLTCSVMPQISAARGAMGHRPGTDGDPAGRNGKGVQFEILAGGFPFVRLFRSASRRPGRARSPVPPIQRSAH